MANEVISGSDLFMWIDDVPVAYSTSYTLSIKTASRVTSNKDSGEIETRDAGRMDVTASCDGMAVYGEYDAILDAMMDGDPVVLQFGARGEGVTTLDETEVYGEGTFLITSFDQNAPDGDNSTYSASFELAEGDFEFPPAV